MSGAILKAADARQALKDFAKINGFSAMTAALKDMFGTEDVMALSKEQCATVAAKLGFGTKLNGGYISASASATGRETPKTVAEAMDNLASDFWARQRAKAEAK